MTPRLLLALTLLLGCRTVEDQLGVAGGSTTQTRLKTTSGDSVDLWRWAPRDAPATKVLVVPEVGFDHRLVSRLCERLRDRGFDVATLEAPGANAWPSAVARALEAHGPRPIVIAIGLGGAAILPIATPEHVRGIVAINVPLRHGIANQALRLALAADGFAPDVWLRHGIGGLLLADGRAATAEVVGELARYARPLSLSRRQEMMATFAAPTAALPDGVPVRALVSVKDNLVASEDALPNGGLGLAHARRLARVEGFQRDYGHLDWLADVERLADVAAAVALEIEAIP
jgi:hypothetical protein